MSSLRSTLVLFSLAATAAFAQPAAPAAETSAPAPAKAAENCLVCGEKLGAHERPVSVNYKVKGENRTATLCSRSCARDFLKKPASYTEAKK